MQRPVPDKRAPLFDRDALSFAAEEIGCDASRIHNFNPVAHDVESDIH
jgi:hypothetical protein